jgi:hypothetical protein
VWEAAPAACAAVICFASDIGSTNVLEFGHHREVSSVSGEVILSHRLIEGTQPLSARLQGSIRFLAIPIPAPPSIRLTVDLPLAGSDTGLPCSAEMTTRR